MSKNFKKFLIVYQFVYFVFCPLLPGWAQTTDKENIRSFGGVPSSAESSSIGVSPIPPTGSANQFSLFYNIHVLGEVVRPGTYRILPSDRVMDALKYAGGILENGSQRRVELRRDPRLFLDIYAYKYRGDLSQNPYLIENDVIFVPVKKAEFQIEGPVNRPGNHEIIKKINLQQAIELGGGFVAGLSTREPIRVVRFDDREKKNIIEIKNSADELNQFNVQKGDVIVVPHMLISKKKFDYNISRIPGDNIFYPTINDKVYVVGAVSTPGPYVFQPSYVAKDYVSQAGPSNGASLGRLKIISADGKKKNISKMYSVNTGDTIIVPSKSITGSNLVLWFGTLTSMALTTFIFMDRFAK